ncbi:GNAT family N-acetyltransferase [Novosphingobium sp. KCTC 2891]|uniref:GNAT family N-acetyltransferase n=1 Tax=Novosphingobium sp. KCTC 2891 TaxID=2989730 RepID=UPI002223228E|nr:GNAT family N-acetyltransferase [Novosphingobium sp. KCTC 2891]MCW1382003.1 GNAT family N-acetyltransferase [Novosphingobium sp. KCTC 2891]
MTLRLARPDDAAALSDLGRRAFVAKFGHLYRPEDLAAFLDGSHTPEKIAGELADPGMTVAVIEEEGDLLAFCKLLHHSSLPRVTDAQRPLELKQLYTDPDRLGRGNGARLMGWALDEARARGADAIELSVWSENPDAQRFYARYGMEKVGEAIFMVGEQADEDWIFSLRL